MLEYPHWACGGIGIRAGLRNQSLTGWEFESPRAHYIDKYYFCAIMFLEDSTPLSPARARLSAHVLLLKMIKILIVDDNKSVRASLGMILEGFGRIELASDGAEAKVLITERYEMKEPFDLIITDVNMREVGGIELIEWVKTTHPDIPCILMSSGDDPKFHRADVFMGKLVNSNIVRETVGKLLESKMSRGRTT